jgi:hypothetical protein
MISINKEEVPIVSSFKLKKNRMIRFNQFSLPFNTCVCGPQIVETSAPVTEKELIVDGAFSSVFAEIFCSSFLNVALLIPE